MSAGNCQYCGKDCKNPRVHERYCKLKPTDKMEMKQESFLPPLSPTLSTPADPIKLNSTIFDKIKGMLPKSKPKVPVILKVPEVKSDLTLSDGGRFEKFFSDLPAWSGYKPSRVKRALISAFNKKSDIAPCVFVSHKIKPKIAYLPWDPEKSIIFNPGKALYEVSKDSSPPFFFDLDHSCELVNSPNLQDRFNLPADIRQADYARGLDEGVTQGIKEILNELVKWKYITYFAIGVALLSLAVMGYVAYTFEAKYNLIASNLNNLTYTVNSRP